MSGGPFELAAVARLGEAERIAGGTCAAGAPCAGAGDFGRMVTEGIATMNEQLLTSQADLQRLAVGDVQNLHQVMIRLEESRISFQLMLQVRNRLLEAYQDLMKMPV